MEKEDYDQALAVISKGLQLDKSSVDLKKLAKQVMRRRKRRRRRRSTLGDHGGSWYQQQQQVCSCLSNHLQPSS